MMPTALLLECNGLEVCGFQIPSFGVGKGELVAIDHPADEGDQLRNLLRVLAGETSTTEIQTHGKAHLIYPFPAYDLRKQELLVYFRSLGFFSKEICQALDHAKVSPTMRYGDLQLTDRLLLEMDVSFLCGFQLLVYSIGGLDPLGLEQVLIASYDNRQRCSSLALFHASIGANGHLIELLKQLCARHIHIVNK